MKTIWREIKDFYNFFKLPKHKKRILFYAEYGGQHSYFEGIIRELTDKHGQNICYITSDIKDPLLKLSDDKITALYINYLLALFMPLIDCEVAVMTLTDLNNYYIKRSKNPVHYVYVFHSMVSTHMIYRAGSFDNYDSILCVGPYQVREIRKYEELNDLPAKNLVKAGYYRLERIYSAYQEYIKNLERNEKPVKPTVLIAPSWGDDNVLESCGEKLISSLLKAEYRVIVRPHMETIKHRFKLINDLENKFLNNPNFSMIKGFAPDDLIFGADVLISDYSGSALSYTFGTERPVLFLDVPPKINNSRFNELNIEPVELSLRSQIGVILPSSKVDLVPQTVSVLISKKDDHKKEIIKIREDNIYAFGHSSEIGAEHVMSLL